MNRRSEQVQAMWIDAAQIVPFQSDAMAIEELENLDGDLTAILDAVAKLSSSKNGISIMSCEIGHDGGHFVNRRAQKKMIVRHFIDEAQAAGEFENSADIAFGIGGCGRNIANAGRPEAILAAE